MMASMKRLQCGSSQEPDTDKPDIEKLLGEKVGRAWMHSGFEKNKSGEREWQPKKDLVSPRSALDVFLIF